MPDLLPTLCAYACTLCVACLGLGEQHGQAGETANMQAGVAVIAQLA